jgi:hypothetical protein
MTSIERQSRYWVSAKVGKKDESLFEAGVQTTWQWARSCQFVRWFSDGERNTVRLSLKPGKLNVVPERKDQEGATSI